MNGIQGDWYFLVTGIQVDWYTGIWCDWYTGGLAYWYSFLTLLFPLLIISLS